jgi:signal peptidase I
VTADQPVVDEVDPEVEHDAPSVGTRRARRRQSARRNTVEWVVVIAGALVVAVIIKTFLFQAFYIPSPSMEPTLKVGDRVLVNKLSYHVHDIHRGDIIVFSRPAVAQQVVDGCDGQPVTIPAQPILGEEDVHDLIKRVVALPGDTVEQRDGFVLVNGKQLDEPYVMKHNGITDRTPQFAFTAQCIKVPPNRVFVLGDNRTNSSASNAFGPILENTIVGRAFIRVWPPSSIGGV